jgi:predicted Fe-Mo cluster-binding NifX family protein
MKAAFAYWDKRIAPVFDTARLIHVIESESGKIINETSLKLMDDQPAQRALGLAEMGINELVCGAVSLGQQALITAYGIKVVSFIAGDLREVIQAWLDGRLGRDIYTMPGCCRHKSKPLTPPEGGTQEVCVMNGRGRGMGQGAGKGRGQGGRGLGRMGGPLAAGPGGTCVCPQCGHTEPHGIGVPCIERTCPKCNAVLIRK